MSVPIEVDRDASSTHALHHGILWFGVCMNLRDHDAATVLVERSLHGSRHASEHATESLVHAEAVAPESRAVTEEERQPVDVELLAGRFGDSVELIKHAWFVCTFSTRSVEQLDAMAERFKHVNKTQRDGTALEDCALANDSTMRSARR
jgi:hypothetical protein